MRRLFNVGLCFLLTCLLCSMNILFSNPTSAFAADFNISVSVDDEGYGSAVINWGDYDYRNKNFKVYKSSDGGNTYESVGIDYKLIKEVKCLQIYPAAGAQDQLKTWMETNEYGKGIIKIDSVSIEEYNVDPDKYLNDDEGTYKYDVILFGTWDSNSSKDLSPVSLEATENFIKSGRGAIFGHDTIRWNNKTTPALPNFAQLASYVNLGPNDYWSIGQYNLSTKVKIFEQGLITNYPWSIGEIGTELTIPACHGVGQNAYGTVWLRFVGDSVTIPEEDPANYYVTTYNNCAMIQTGHSSGAATEDEQKIIANLIFYMNQLLFNAAELGDASAQDYAAPDKPTISYADNDTIGWEAEDNGTPYYYYVEAYSKNDSTETGLLDTSNVAECIVKTGVDHYIYKYDNTMKTVLTEDNGQTTTDTTVPVSEAGDNGFIHVAAVDGAGNLGETETFQLLTGDYPIEMSADSDSYYPGEEITYTINQDLNSMFFADDEEMVGENALNHSYSLEISIPRFVSPNASSDEQVSDEDEGEGEDGYEGDDSLESFEVQEFDLDDNLDTLSEDNDYIDFLLDGEDISIPEAEIDYDQDNNTVNISIPGYFLPLIKGNFEIRLHGKVGDVVETEESGDEVVSSDDDEMIDNDEGIEILSEISDINSPFLSINDPDFMVLDDSDEFDGKWTSSDKAISSLDGLTNESEFVEIAVMKVHEEPELGDDPEEEIKAPDDGVDPEPDPEEPVDDPIVEPDNPQTEDPTDEPIEEQPLTQPEALPQLAKTGEEQLPIAGIILGILSILAVCASYIKDKKIK